MEAPPLAGMCTSPPVVPSSSWCKSLMHQISLFSVPLSHLLPSRFFAAVRQAVGRQTAAAHHEICRCGNYLARGLPATKETAAKRSARARDGRRNTGRTRLPSHNPTRKYAKGSLSNAKFTKMPNPFAKPLKEWFFLPFWQIIQIAN